MEGKTEGQLIKDQQIKERKNIVKKEEKHKETETERENSKTS